MGRAGADWAPRSLWRWIAGPARRWSSSAASAEAKRMERLDSAPDEEHLPIRALYIGQAVDIARLFRSHYRDMPHAVQRRNVVVTLERLQEPGVVEIKPWGGGRMIRKRQSGQRFVVFHDYGGVVFFNCSRAEQERVLETTMPFVTDAIEFPNEEDYSVSVQPSYPKWCDFKENMLVIRDLDTNCVRIISNVMARSVALEHYEREADSMVERFRTINAKVATSGSLTIRSDNLFKVVALQNQIMTEIIQRLNLLDRSRPGDAAWEYENYERLWEGMADEFNLSKRFNNLDYKIDLIKHSAKFFLEVLSNRQDKRLEIMIILLIAAELSISVADKFM